MNSKLKVIKTIENCVVCSKRGFAKNKIIRGENTTCASDAHFSACTVQYL